MQLVEMRERMTALLTELKPLHEASERSAEQEARIDAIIGEVNDLGPRIERETIIAATAARRADYAEPVRRVGGSVPAEEREDVVIDMRSVGRRFVQSDQFARARQHPRGTSEPMAVDGSFFPQYFRNEPDMDKRTLVYSGTAPASMLLPQVIPTVYRGMERPLVMRDVLLNIQTASDAIVVMQETSFTNAAAEVAEATTTSGGAKPESALAFTEVSYPVRTIAHWIPITRQMLQDLPAMESYVNDRLMTGLMRREDNQILNGDGQAPNLTGILATSGIQDLNAAYWAANPVNDAGTDNEPLNRLLRAKTKIAVTGEAQATFIVANPADVETWLTLTDGDRMYLVGGGPAGNATIPTVWGLPIVQSENIAAGTALVGDGSMAAVADRMMGQIFTTDSHSDFFTKNIFVVLAEERLALPVFRPAAFAKVALS